MFPSGWLQMGCALAALALAACAAQAEPLRLYVAADGNDAWLGELAAPNAARTDGPLATLHRARDAARALRGDAPPTEAVVIEVGEGTYYLDEPLLLGPEDSGTVDCPVTWRAREGEQVTISGGRPIEGPWRSDDGMTWYTQIPEVKSEDWFFRQLRVGDQRAQRCRHPNADPADPYGGTWLYAAPPNFTRNLGLNFATGLGALQQKGTWLEYDIEVPADGEYALRVLYANNGETNTRFFGFTDMSNRTSVSVDGGEAVPVADLTDTGSFYEGFRWARAATMQLTAGEHSFRWTNTEGGALSLLAFVLIADPEFELPLPGGEGVDPPQGHLVTFNATDYDRRHGDLVTVHNMLDRKDKAFHTGFSFYAGDMKKWEHLTDAEVYVIPEYDWVSELVRLTAVDEEAGVARIEGANATKPIMPQNRYCVLNVLDVLDQPGEWCLVTAEGRLYYRPLEADFREREIVAPRLDRVIELRGDVEGGVPVSHIRFEGFTITDTGYTSPARMTDTYHVNDGAVWLVGAERCHISKCTFRDVGGYGVWLHDASRENVIVANEVMGAGQGGVYMDGYVRNSFREVMPDGRRPWRNLVAGNHIHHCGLLYAHVAGVYSAVSGENVIAHNSVHHMPRYGISLKGNCPEAVVDHNEVRFTNLLTRDTGAIEMAGNYAGSVVRYNLVTDAIGSGFRGQQGRHVSPCDACGIYLDNLSSNNTVVGNIVTRCSSGVWMNMGGGNLIENNIFYNNRESQALLNVRREEMRPRGLNTVRCNIMVCSAPDTVAYRVHRWVADSEELLCERNCIWAGGGPPGFIGLSGSPAEAWATWQEGGQDAGSVLEDPRFADPEHDDFTLADDSPALALGFEPIEVSRIGLAGYREELIAEFLGANINP